MIYSIYIYLFKLYQNWMMTGICFLDESQLLDCLLMGFHTSIHYHVIVITTCGTPRHCLYLGLALLRRTRPLEYLECLSPTLLGQYWLMKQNMKGTWHTRRWNGPQGKLLIGLLDVYGHRSPSWTEMGSRHRSTHGKTVELKYQDCTSESCKWWPNSIIDAVACPCFSWSPGQGHQRLRSHVAWIPMISMIPGKEERLKSNFCCLNPFVYCSYCKTCLYNLLFNPIFSDRWFNALWAPFSRPFACQIPICVA